MTKLEELKIKAEELKIKAEEATKAYKAEEATKAYKAELNKPKKWSPNTTKIDFKANYYYIDFLYDVILVEPNPWDELYILDLVKNGDYFTLEQLELAEKEADRRFEASLMSAYVRENDHEFDLDEAIKNEEDIYYVAVGNQKPYIKYSPKYDDKSPTTVYMSVKIAFELEDKLTSGEVSFKRER